MSFLIRLPTFWCTYVHILKTHIWRLYVSWEIRLWRIITGVSAQLFFFSRWSSIMFSLKRFRLGINTLIQNAFTNTMSIDIQRKKKFKDQALYFYSAKLNLVSPRDLFLLFSFGVIASQAKSETPVKPRLPRKKKKVLVRQREKEKEKEKKSFLFYNETIR